MQDFTDRARADRVSARSSFLARIAPLDRGVLGSDDVHDYTLLCLAVDEEIFDLTALYEVEYNPGRHAARRFVEDEFLEPPLAEKEAMRGTFDPGDLHYASAHSCCQAPRESVRSR